MAERARWLAIDTETTGLGETDEIIEIAAITAPGAVALDLRLRPTCAIHPEATRVHGLTAERLEGSAAFVAVYPQILQVLAHQQVHAFNADFERRLLASTCARYDLPEIPVSWTCTMEAYACWRGFRTTLRLACEIEGLEPPPAEHRALADAQALQRLVWRMLSSPT